MKVKNEMHMNYRDIQSEEISNEALARQYKQQIRDTILLSAIVAGTTTLYIEIVCFLLGTPIAYISNIMFGLLVFFSFYKCIRKYMFEEGLPKHPSNIATVDDIAKLNDDEQRLLIFLKSPYTEGDVYRAKMYVLKKQNDIKEKDKNDALLENQKRAIRV